MPTEETRLHFEDKEIYFYAKPYPWWPMQALRKYLLQNKNVCYGTNNVYYSTKISIYSEDNFFSSNIQYIIIIPAQVCQCIAFRYFVQQVCFFSSTKIIIIF